MEITIHHMLHGYEDGHNYIRGSIYLSSSKDMDTIASLSDWSEYINSKDDSSYLSAYPLVESGYYVIARTWYAEEMKRPGCVWTHSILIPTGLLKVISDYRVIDSLFKRPTKDDYEFYGSPLKFDIASNTTEKHLNVLKDTTGIPFIIKNLVVGNKPSIYEVETDSETYRYLCLMIMNVLPSCVLENSSFCSGTNGLRALDGKPFDVQFTTLQNHYVKSLVSNEQDIEDGFLYSSMYVKNEVLSLGKLIRLFEEEIGTDSNKYCSLCELILLVNSDKETKEKCVRQFDKMLNIISTVYPKPQDGVLIKNRFLSRPITSLFLRELDFVSLLATSEIYKSLQKENIEFEKRINDLAEDINTHADFIAMLSHLCESSYINEWGMSLLSQVDKYLSERDIDSIISTSFDTYLSIAALCPSILNKGVWDEIPGKGLKDILSLLKADNVQSSFNRWDYLLEILLKKCVDSDGFISSCLYSKCPDYVSVVMNSLNQSYQVSKMQNILKTCAKNQDVLIKWINGRIDMSEPVLDFLSNVIDPFSPYVKQMGAKAFSGFISMQKPMQMKFYTFLFILSFNWTRDVYSMEFLRQSFYPIHKSLAEGTMSDSLWEKIAPLTCDVPIWQSWDKCKKLRKVVVKRVLEVGLYEDYLQTFTPDTGLNQMLVKTYKKKKK